MKNYVINDPKLSKDDLRKLVYTENVSTLLQDGLGKVLDGITSFEEIYKLIEIDDELDSRYEEDDYLQEDVVNNNIVNNENNINDTIVQEDNDDNFQNTEMLDLGLFKEE